MKKLITLNICAVIILFLTAGICSFNEDYVHQVKGLVSQRIEILNDYYKGEKTAEDTLIKLKKIERGNIYKADKKNIKAYANTDVDQIIRYKINMRTSSKSNYGIIKAVVRIDFLMKGVTGENSYCNDYYVTCQIKKEKIKITKIKKL